MREQGHFYGRRKGKPLRATRSKMLEESPYLLREGGAVDFLSGYKKHTLEIGFGNGEHLVAQAQAHPETGFIGCEAFINGVTACLQQITTSNIRLWSDDALLLLQDLSQESFDRIYILFPDPWPKTRHHKRRFIQHDTVELLAGLLKPAGLLRMATDDHNLAQWMLLHTVQNPAMRWTTVENAEWRTPPQDWVETRYQQKALAQGRTAYFIDAVKN